MLFPATSDAGLTVVPGPKDKNVVTRPVNPLVGNNEAQMQAVRSIVAMKVGAAPFVVFGP